MLRIIIDFIVIIIIIVIIIMTDIIFRVVEVGGRDGTGTNGFICVSVNLDLEKKNQQKMHSKHFH